MSIEKRPRGRPCGTGKRDIPHLMRVADLLVSEPELKPTTAMKRVMRERNDWRETDATLIRRWQIKWKAKEASFLAAAHERRRARCSTVMMTDLVNTFRQLDETFKAMQNSPTLRQLDETIKAMQNSPTLRQLDETIKAIQNSPTLRQLDETIKAMQNQAVCGRHSPRPENGQGEFSQQVV
jgi:hypothetical protein